MGHFWLGVDRRKGGGLGMGESRGSPNRFMESLDLPRPKSRDQGVTPADSPGLASPIRLRLWLLAGLLALLGYVAGCRTAPSKSGQGIPFPATTFVLPQPPLGPTLDLQTVNSSGSNEITSFMYFIPLTAPEPVRTEASPGNSQYARLISIERRADASSFRVSCHFEIVGEGYLRSVFDHSRNWEREQARLQAGGSLDRQLDTITVEGAGTGAIEVEGTISNRLASVTEVSLRFNANGRPSPVTIGLADFRMVQGRVVATNEQVARINVLSFRATTNARPRMAVTVDSVRPRQASAGLWGRVSGAVVGMAANLFLKPIRIDAAGHDAMLRFGAHLAAGRESFTFPRAAQLQAPAAPPPSPSKPPN